MGDEKPSHWASKGEEQSGWRRKHLRRKTGGSHESDKGGAQRTKCNRPAVPQRGDHYRLQRCETQAHQDRGDHCHRHPETTDALQEGGEDPANDQCLHPFVRRQMGQGTTDGFNGAGLICHAVKQKGSPDDEQNIYGEQQCFGMGVS